MNSAGRVLRLSTLFGILLALAGNGFASEEVVRVTNLSDDARFAREHRLPLLLMLSALDCTFCERLKRDYINPIAGNDRYRNKIVIRELFIDDGSWVIDFDGQKISTRNLGIRYAAELTPTLLFVDYQGNELTEAIVGYTTPELYGYYLDNAIDEAGKTIAK